MNTFLGHLFRPLAGRRAAVLLGPLLALGLALAACGDDEATQTGTATGGTTAVQPQPPGDGGAVASTDIDPGSGGIPDLPDNDDPSAVQCTGAPEQVFDATAIVGRPLDEATRAARAAGCDVRVVIEDGEALAVTDDFRPDRINVVVADGTVERIEGLY
jgi:hypothetical protein